MGFLALQLCFQFVDTNPKLDSEKNGVCIGIYRVFRGCACRGVGDYIYIYTNPSLLSTHWGLLTKGPDVENLGLEMCMDESLGRRYLSLTAWHGSGLADKRNHIQQSYSYPSSVKKANRSVKGSSPGHGYSQNQK